jgi:hypothetical protein
VGKGRRSQALYTNTIYTTIRIYTYTQYTIYTTCITHTLYTEIPYTLYTTRANTIQILSIANHFTSYTIKKHTRYGKG